MNSPKQNLKNSQERKNDVGHINQVMRSMVEHEHLNGQGKRWRMFVKKWWCWTYSSLSIDASNSAFSLMKAFCKADICAMILARLSWASRAFLAFSSSWETLLTGEGRVATTTWGFSWRAAGSSCKLYEITHRQLFNYDQAKCCFPSHTSSHNNSKTRNQSQLHLTS